MRNVAEVLLEAEAIEPDVQTRIVCPFCQGGTTEERCMSIIRTSSGEVKFICHRSNCGIAGRSNSPYSVVADKPRPPRQLRPVQLRDLSRSEYDMIWEKWGITAHAAGGGWRWDELSNRLAMSVYGPLGNIRGLVLRAMDNAQPKVLTVRWQADEPFLAWFRPQDINSECVILVEDIPSALKTFYACPSMATVALNGTHISDDAILELQRCRATHGRLVIALDEDASVLALEYARNMEAIFGRVRVILLDRDFKNMEEKEIQACLRNALS